MEVYALESLDLAVGNVQVFDGKIKVLHDRQVVEQAPSFRDMGDGKLADDLVGGIFEQVFPHVGHFSPRLDGDHSGYRAQSGALSGAIRADDAHDLAFLDVEVYALESLDLADPAV